MIIHNKQIAEKFDAVADLLDIKGANEYRVRAYRNAARTLRRQSERIQNMVKEGKDLTKLSGIGEDLAGKIKEIVNTGKLSLLQKVKREIPGDLLDILEVQGLGPKRVKALYEELGIETKSDLQSAIYKKEIREIPGFGRKIEKNIKESLKDEEENNKRTLLKNARNLIAPFYKYLSKLDDVEEVHVAGSYRRRKETVGDIDFLVLSSVGKKVIQDFVSYEEVDEIISEGKTKSSVKLKSGLQVDLRVMKKKSKAAALIYFTGSKSHNVKLRKIALDYDYKINEYGVFH